MRILTTVAKSRGNALVVYTWGGVLSADLAQPRPVGMPSMGAKSRQNVIFVKYPADPFD